ncbi:MAG: 1-acyl-sn-glycerol-3-phosphate acyltransferase [Gemmatimonadaceae bacterium]
MPIAFVPWLVDALSRRSLRWMYREIHYVGRERIPATGAVLLFGNHPNDLPDVLAGFYTTRRPVRYIATISATTMPLAGAVYRGLGVIPVARARDVRKMRERGMDLTAINQAAAGAVHDAFVAGTVVGVFPEGGLHDHAHIGKTRPGVPMMVLDSFYDGAISGRIADITMVPFGVQYEAPREPRSDLTVVIGAPVSLREWQAAQAEPSAPALGEQLHQALAAVTRNSSSWPNAAARDRLIAAVAALSASPDEPILASTASVQHRCAQLVEGRDPSQAGELPHPDGPHWRTLADPLAEWVERLGGKPTSARDTARVLDAAGAANPQALWPAIYIVTLHAPLALVGSVIHGPLFRVVWALARRMAEVRTDVLTRAIVPGLHLIFLGYLLLGGLMATVAHWCGWSPWWALPPGLLLPRLGDLTIRWHDAVRALRLRRRVRALSADDRSAMLVAAERVRAAWTSLVSSSPVSL